MNDLTRIREKALAMPTDKAKKYIYDLMTTAGQISWYFHKVLREELESRENSR